MGSGSTSKSSKRRQSDAAAAGGPDPVIEKEKKEKKEKKDKKRKSVGGADAEIGDVSMADVEAEPEVKKDSKESKKEKKEKKEKSKKREADGDVDMADAGVDGAEEEKKSKKNKTKEAGDEVVRYLVPFAEPLATEDETAKVYEAVRRASRNRALLTGIKETQKALRKATQAKSSSTSTSTSTTSDSTPRGVVVVAGDTYPLDIISHLPVMCEDAGMPLIYVTSREKLGRASGSNRIQTSAMMVLSTKGVKKAGKDKESKESKDKKEKDGEKKKKSDGEVGEDEYKKQFEKFVKVVAKANERVKV